MQRRRATLLREGSGRCLRTTAYGEEIAAATIRLALRGQGKSGLTKRFSISAGTSTGTMFAVLLFMVAAERPAHAYTDPGSGMLIWQGVVAAFLGASFYFRKFFYKLFGKKPTDTKQE